MVASTHQLKLTVLHEKELRKQGYNLITAVGQGAKEPPRIVVRLALHALLPCVMHEYHRCSSTMAHLSRKSASLSLERVGAAALLEYS